MIAARHKRKPTYEDYMSCEELISMYNSVANTKHFDYRVYATITHLVIEVALKKIALHLGLEVSNISHNVGSLIFDISDKVEYKSKFQLGYAIKEQHQKYVNKGVFTYLQRFPYDALRFNKHINVEVPTVEFLNNLLNIVLNELELVEKERSRY